MIYTARFLTASLMIAVAICFVSAVAAMADSPSLVVPPSERSLELALELPPQLALDEADAVELIDASTDRRVGQGWVVPAASDEGIPTDKSRRLIAKVEASGQAGQSRRLRVVPQALTSESVFAFEKDEQTVTLLENGSPVWGYRYARATNPDVPESDRRRTRGCYIHPLYGVHGEVLTDDFPRDHYHHHGVFWTWPHVKVGGKEYDLWTDVGGIHQRFERWLDMDQSPVAASLAVENGWYVPEGDGHRKIMIERIWVRTFPESDGCQSLDLEMTWIPTDRAVTLWGAGGKSYGGLTVRFHPPSANAPCTTITTPDGTTDKDLPDTPLTWADYTSCFDGREEPSGAAIFVSPDHPDYPPTWLTRHYGAMCVGWPGVEPKTFQPGQPVTLRYRIWIHGDAPDLETLSSAYRAYTAGSEVQWK